jgi:hypothetical protein
MGVAYEGNAIGRRDPSQRRGLRDVCTTARIEVKSARETKKIP